MRSRLLPTLITEVTSYVSQLPGLFRLNGPGTLESPLIH